MSMIAKIGPFSDGGRRFRVVAPGYDADPAPADRRKIIFDSDWPEALASAPGYYGKVTIPQPPSGPAAVNFAAALSFPPPVFFAKSAANTLSYSGGNIITPLVASTLASALVMWPSVQLGAVVGTSAEATVSNSGFTCPAPGFDGVLAWLALITNPGAPASSAPSRAGTAWAKWTKDGPVIARPGKDVASSDYADYLIPPIASGRVLTQPVIAGNVSSLPWVRNETVNGTVYGVYQTVIAHGLGFTPMFFGTCYFDFRSPPTQAFSPLLAADSSNFYLIHPLGAPGSSGATASLLTTSYFVLPRVWA